jgi:hypothetical protein
MIKNRFFILLIGMFIFTLFLPRCEKDNDDNTDAKLNYRPTQRTSKMNGEYYNRETFNYESDRLIFYEHYDIEFGNSEFSDKYIYEYPDENTIIREDYDMTEIPPDSTRKWIYTVDEDRITEIICYLKGLFTDEWELSSRSVFTYLGDQVTEEKNYWYVEGEWKIYSKKTYNYEDNKITERITYKYDDLGVEEVEWDSEFEYEGDKLTQTLSNYKGSPAYKRIPEYDGKMVISATTFSWESGTWGSYYKSEYEYDENGNCNWEKEFYFETSEEYIIKITFEEGKSNYSLLMEWPGSVRIY